MKIKLTQGQFTIVSNKYYEYLIQWKWCAHKRKNGKFYAVRNGYVNGKRKTILMHRVIAELIGLDLSCDIDHIDRDSLNNTCENLRSANKNGTCRNSSIRCDNTSGYKNVTWRKDIGKWQVQITINGKQKHLGFFRNKIEAAKAYNKAAIKYFDKFAAINEGLN